MSQLAPVDPALSPGRLLSQCTEYISVAVLPLRRLPFRTRIICLGAPEKFDNRSIARRKRDHVRRPLVLAGFIYSRAAFNEELADFKITSRGRVIERGPTLLMLLIHVTAILDQPCSFTVVPSLYCFDQSLVIHRTSRATSFVVLLFNIRCCRSKPFGRLQPLHFLETILRLARVPDYKQII